MFGKVKSNWDCASSSGSESEEENSKRQHSLKKSKTKSKKMTKNLGNMKADPVKVASKINLDNESWEIASVSGSEDEDNNNKHANLMNSINKLNKRKRNVAERTEASATTSEFGITPADSEKVRLNDLLLSLNKTTRMDMLHKKVQSSRKGVKVLNEPLPKPQALRVKRAVAYEMVSKNISVWDNIVHKNRAASSQVFPLDRTSKALPTSEDVVKRYQLVTPLETEIKAVLGESKEGEKIENFYKSKEKNKKIANMTLEETLQWKKEMQKLRALQSYQVMKLRRQNKIKSKRYHRILKRERLKKEIKEFEQLQHSNPELFLKKLEDADKRRIEERITLKHRGTGKWAKQQKIRAKYDTESRKALKEQLELNRILKTKQHVTSDSEEDNKDPHEDNSNNIPSETSKYLFPDMAKDITLDPQDVVTVNTKVLRSHTPHIAVTGDNSESEDEQVLTIQEAFEDDDVIGEFQLEKKSAVEEDQPKDIDLTLPGWGEWGGANIKVSERKRKRFLIKAPIIDRKDKKLPNVIINEKKNEKLREHRISECPFPFADVDEFEKNLSGPVGNTWNPQTAFYKFIAPKVTTEMGSIIEPINKEALLPTKKNKRRK